MKVLIRNVDHVVMYAGDDLTLTATDLQGDGWRDPHYSTANATIVQATPPALWAGALWTYTGGVWAVFDVALHATLTTQAAQGVRERSKISREQAVAQIKVTTAAGNTFDGDETSQSRMSRAIIALGTGLAPSVNWVLADNSVILATAAELTEALVLAGQAQAAVWVV